jgi:hypothetical protein
MNTPTATADRRLLGEEEHTDLEIHRSRSVVFSYLVTIVVVATLSVIITAQSPLSSFDIERSRIERLAGLARVWGGVKYFHPSLAFA